MKNAVKNFSTNGGSAKVEFNDGTIFELVRDVERGGYLTKNARWIGLWKWSGEEIEISPIHGEKKILSGEEELVKFLAEGFTENSKPKFVKNP